MNAAVVRLHSCVCCSMAAFALVGIQIFADRLPWSRPVILAVIVAYVNIASRLVKAIEHITQNPAVSPWFRKAVTTRIVGDHRAVLRGAKIVRPRRRRVRSGNHILSFLIIKITILHFSFSPFAFTNLFRPSASFTNRLCNRTKRHINHMHSAVKRFDCLLFHAYHIWHLCHFLQFPVPAPSLFNLICPIGQLFRIVIAD